MSEELSRNWLWFLVNRETILSKVTCGTWIAITRSNYKIIPHAQTIEQALQYGKRNELPTSSLFLQIGREWDVSQITCTASFSRYPEYLVTGKAKWICKPGSGRYDFGTCNQAVLNIR
jgi:hypothetical protein